MSLLSVIILGLVQGLTEFLPISSSGHLVLMEHLLKVKMSGVTFEVFLHFGTLIAVIVAFQKELRKMVQGIFRGSLTEPSVRLFFLLLFATIPAAVVGFFLKSSIEKTFQSMTFVASALLFTGVILFLTRFVRRDPPLILKRSTGIAEDKCGVNVVQASIIGLAQALAILPGVSRSGMTISAGLFSGIKGKDAAEFSFLLSIPAILGATILELKEILSSIRTIPIISYTLGVIIAAISGYLAIKLVLNFIKKGKFEWFAYYCWTIGILGLVL
ncbi:MAG: undecaprenyl-diphosphate phosphatase [Candidatus Edwardsbacteria bacterium]